MPLRRLVALSFPLLVLAALWWWYSTGAGDWQMRPPQLFGRVWTTAPAPSPSLLFVTREERERYVYQSRWTYFTEHYDRYALHVHRIADGALEGTLPLGDLEERQETTAPQILGIVGDVVWLWRDGPEARSLPGLELRCDTARARQVAPAAAELLPQLPKGYALRTEPRSLVLRGRDAQLYTFDATTAALTPLAATDLPANNFSTRLEDRFDHLQPPGRSLTFTSPYNVLQRAFLTRTGKWYALLTDGERHDLTQHVPNGRPYGDVARRLYRADYVMDGRSPKLDLPTVATIGDERLLQAGFLIRNAETLWDVPEPSSTLVLAKARLGETEPWQLVRLARDGSVPWRVSTELADLGEMLDLGTHVLFVGQRVRAGSGDPATRDVRERLAWIDERTGTMRTLFVASGELVPPLGP